MLPTIMLVACPGPNPFPVGGIAVPASAPLIRSWSPAPGPVVSRPIWTQRLGRIVPLVVNVVPFWLTRRVTVRPLKLSAKPLLAVSVDRIVPPFALSATRSQIDAVYAPSAD